MASGSVSRHAVKLVCSARGIKYFPGLETAKISPTSMAENQVTLPSEEAAQPEASVVFKSSSSSNGWRIPVRMPNVHPGTRAVNYFPDLPKPEAEKESSSEPQEHAHDAYAHQPDVMGHSIAGPRSDYFPSHVHVPEGGRRFSLPEMSDIHRHSLMEPMGRNSMMDPSDGHSRRQGLKRSSIYNSLL